MPRKRKAGKPSLDEEYRYQAKKRSHWGIDGFPSAAASGDRDALRKCAAMAAVLVERAEFKPEFHGLQGWLVDCLNQIYAGQSPDEAFGWKRKRSGRPGREFATVFKQWLIGQHMDGLINGPETYTIEKAAAVVARDRKCEIETAIECYRHFRGG